ncbi:unnamed protein product [Macrosiphum euphorbiae]|uniref:Uncharacterized protein n=1 Tax=Macrosiphum euphorbiae TaxID=13131 RepID=A0AAV0XSG3_9HEMI|nr:unnamed protein product [Macrosiphum euphorbiae]
MASRLVQPVSAARGRGHARLLGHGVYPCEECNWSPRDAHAARHARQAAVHVPRVWNIAFTVRRPDQILADTHRRKPFECLQCPVSICRRDTISKHACLQTQYHVNSEVELGR